MTTATRPRRSVAGLLGPSTSGPRPIRRLNNRSFIADRDLPQRLERRALVERMARLRPDVLPTAEAIDELVGDMDRWFRPGGPLSGLGLDMEGWFRPGGPLSGLGAPGVKRRTPKAASNPSKPQPVGSSRSVP